MIVLNFPPIFDGVWEVIVTNKAEKKLEVKKNAQNCTPYNEKKNEHKRQNKREKEKPNWKWN